MSHHPLVTLLRLAWPTRGWMLLSVLLGALTIGASIGLMSAAAWIIATAALHPSVAVISVAVVGVRFFGIARGLLRYAERLVSHEMTFRLLARLRAWFYAGLEPLAPARLLAHRSGDLLARIAADVETLQNVFLRVIAPPLVALCVAAGMALFMALHDPRLALNLLVFLALAGIGVPLFADRLGRRTGAALIQTRADLTAALVDGVQGLPDLLASSAEGEHVARIAALSAEYRAQQARLAQIGGLQTALLALITPLAVIGTLVIAIPLVEAGRYSGVILAVLALATVATFEAVAPLPAAFQHLGASLAAARRLFALVPPPDGPIVIPAATPVPAPPLSAPELHIADLRFRYASEAPPALDGITLDLAPGTVTALIGPSGAGKSTLLGVLLRFWEGWEGTITVGGHDLRALDPEAARALFSVVSQHTHLFNATIAENLRLADPAADDAALIRACQAAQLHDFIAGLPQGYATPIGELGLRLSGGERQRLAIARAILKDAPFLLLDEPTANLDPLTERAILGTIFAALPGRTTLLITHRLTGLERADQVLVLEAGRIVARRGR